jgi:ribosomal-protein-alanine N-acetyltransferase
MSIKSEREIVLRRMQEIETEAWVAMMNHPKLAKHLPLLRTPFTLEDAKEFVLIKESYWETHGYGPWALLNQNKLMGWGGFQPCQEQAELALVLQPNWWGWGKECLQKFIEHNSYSRLTQLIVRLPNSRKNLRGMERLGFQQQGVTFIDGNLFFQFFKNLKTNN